MPDRADVQVGAEGAEGPLDLGQGLVGGDHLAAVQVSCLDAGAHHVDAVELGLGGDGVLVAGVTDAVVGDLDGEVLSDLAAAEDPVGAHGNLVLAAQRPPGPRAGGGDLGQVGLGGREERFALAGAFGFQERVLAGYQPLAGEVRGGDLGQVLDIEQGQLQVAVPDQRLDLRGAQRGDPVLACGPDVFSQLGGGEHAPVPGEHHLGKPEPVLELVDLAGHGGGVSGVAGEDLDATGMPSLLVSSS